METIYLAGYHGTGKTIVGKLIASRKDLKFIDTDLMIEEKEGKTKYEVISSNGIDYFCNLEKSILKNDVKQGMIVSLSSDGARDEENRRIIKTSGRVIYLRAKADTVMERLKKDGVSIDNSNNMSVLSIEKKMDEIKPYYEELANYIIDVDDKKLNSVFMEALAIYNYANKVKCHIFIK